MAENNNSSNNNNKSPTTEVVVAINDDGKKTDVHTSDQQQQQPGRRVSNSNVANQRQPKPPQFKSTKLRSTMIVMHLITFLVSIPLLYEGIWLLYVQQYNCEELLEALPFMQLIIAMSLIVGFLLSLDVVVCFLPLQYTVGLIIGVGPLVLMTIVGLTLTGNFDGDILRQVPGTPGWLDQNVLQDDNWSNIQSCLMQSNMCKDLISRSRNFNTYYDFTATNKLSPVELGCCTPPPICKMESLNMTKWRRSNKVANINYNNNNKSNNNSIGDCDSWRFDEGTMCYTCNACKLGFLKTLKDKWLNIGMFLVVMSFLLVISHILLMIVKISFYAASPNIVRDYGLL